MVKHASSHGFAVLICTVTSAFLIEVLKPLLPEFYRRVQILSIRLIHLFDIPIHVEFLNVIILASILALIWGMFFKRYLKSV